jgi:prophage regulatory protein
MHNSSIIKLPEVVRKTGLSRSSVYSYIRQGIFPKPVPLGPRAVGWVASEFEHWLGERANLRNGGVR